MNTAEMTVCDCGHPHIQSLGDDGADAGCERLGKGCDCWEWRETVVYHQPRGYHEPHAVTGTGRTCSTCLRMRPPKP